MNKIATYLQSHISGDVLESDRIRDAYSQDGSVLTIVPSFVIYPRTTNDVRKVARFCWQLAEKKHALPITPRGCGSDTSGAAIGKGISMSMPAYMGRILELDTKQRLVRVQPGTNFAALQETLHTHGLCIPVSPANPQNATIGGALANNAGGATSQKYGSILHWVDKLEVVLANGEVIQTGRISKKELKKRKGLTSLEGEIYRAVDGIVSDKAEALAAYRSAHPVSRDNLGYNFFDVMKKDGSCDLTPLFVGSQGTLGIISEIILKAAPWIPRTDMLVATFATVDEAAEASERIVELAPASIEMINGGLISFVKKQLAIDPLANVFESTENVPEVVLFIEFDEPKARKGIKKAKKARKVLQQLAKDIIYSNDHEQIELLRALRERSLVVVNYNKSGKAAVPIVDDCIVPQGKLTEFVRGITEIAAKYKFDPAIWGHAGEVVLHVYPIMDLSKLSERQKVFRIMDDYYRMVLGLGGSIAADNAEGRLRCAYMTMQLGEELAIANLDLKKACDPYNLLNPGVKSDTTLDNIVDILRNEYSTAPFADGLVRN